MIQSAADLLKYLVDDLRSRRHALGLTQAQVAAMLGIPRAEISMYENLYRKPSFRVLSRWYNALGGELRGVWFGTEEA